MNTSPAQNLTERPVANQPGWLKTAPIADRLSRIDLATNRMRGRDRRIRHWLLVVGDWRLNLVAASRFPIANRRSRITNHQVLTFAFLIVTLIGLGGCGSDKTSKTTVVPRELTSDVERISLVRFSSDGKLLVAGSANGDVLVWNASGDRPVKLESGRTSPLVSMTWSPDGLLAVTDLELGFVGWQFGKTEPDRVEFPQLASAANCIAFRPNISERELVLGMQDGSLIFIDNSGSKQPKPDHRGPVKQALYSLDGKWLVTAGADGKLLWRDAATRLVVHSVKASDTDISRIVLDSDGKQLVSGDWNGRLKIWDLATRKLVREFEQPEAVSGLGWVRGELISGSWDGTLRGWDISSKRVLRSIVTGGVIHDLATDIGTSQVATVHLDRTVRVWDWQAATPE